MNKFEVSSRLMRDMRLVNRKGVRIDSYLTDDILHALNAIFGLLLGHANERKLNRIFKDLQGSLTNVT